MQHLMYVEVRNANCSEVPIVLSAASALGRQLKKSQALLKCHQQIIDEIKDVS